MAYSLKNRVALLLSTHPERVYSIYTIANITGAKDVRLVRKALVQLRDEGRALPTTPSEDSTIYLWGHVGLSSPDPGPYTAGA